MIKYDNSKLRGRIREILGSEAELARHLGLPRSAISARLNGVTQFTRNEICLTTKVLKLKKTDIGAYFFNEGEE